MSMNSWCQLFPWFLLSFPWLDCLFVGILPPTYSTIRTSTLDAMRTEPVMRHGDSDAFNMSATCDTRTHALLLTHTAIRLAMIGFLHRSPLSPASYLFPCISLFHQCQVPVETRRWLSEEEAGQQDVKMKAAIDPEPPAEFLMQQVWGDAVPSDRSHPPANGLGSGWKSDVSIPIPYYQNCQTNAALQAFPSFIPLCGSEKGVGGRWCWLPRNRIEPCWRSLGLRFPGERCRFKESSCYS